MLSKILKIILASFLSLNFFASDVMEIDYCKEGFELNDSGYCLKVLDNNVERRKGLMFENNLPKGHRVIFEWSRVKKICMWMKNTSLPLDIKFFNPATNQVIVEKGIPFSEKKICHRAKIVTEANRGELVKNSDDYGLLLKYVN